MNQTPKTGFADISMIPMDDIPDYMRFGAASLLPSFKQLVTEKTGQLLSEAVETVPDGMAVLTTTRILNLEQLQNNLAERNIPVGFYDIPWHTSAQEAAAKFHELRGTRSLITSAIQATAEYLLHASPNGYAEKIENDIKDVKPGLGLKLDANLFMPGRERETMEILRAISRDMPKGVKLQVILEPKREIFPEIHNWIEFIRDFKRKNPNIEMLFSFDMAELDYYSTAGNSLNLLEQLLDQGDVALDEVGAIELSGHEHSKPKAHLLPWNTPFTLPDLFLSLKRKGLIDIPIIIETDPRLARELINQLPHEYTTHLKSIFQ